VTAASASEKQHCYLQSARIAVAHSSASASASLRRRSSQSSFPLVMGTLVTRMTFLLVFEPSCTQVTSPICSAGQGFFGFKDALTWAASLYLRNPATWIILLID